MKDGNPDGFKRVALFGDGGGEVLSNGRTAVVIGNPNSTWARTDDGESLHNCDAMGCGMSHVIWRGYERDVCNDCDEDGLIYVPVRCNDEGDAIDEEAQVCPSCQGTRLGAAGMVIKDLRSELARLRRNAPTPSPAGVADVAAVMAYGRRLSSRHPMAPDVCPECKWCNGEIDNYGSPETGSLWLCHGCAARRIRGEEPMTA